MSPPPRLFPGDEDLAKRDDDHRPGTGRSMLWRQRTIPIMQRRLAKRVVVGIVTLVAFYFFFKNMPTDLKQPRTRPHYIRPTNESPLQFDSSPQPHPPPAKTKQDPDPDPNHQDGLQPPLHTFGGPIKFYELAVSLRTVAVQTKGSDIYNRNVVFAASSMKSASTLLPLACEMASHERNYVHFALMGRDDIPMEIFKSINGVTKDCKVIFHDARPDFGPISSDFRMTVSASAGFNHINTFVHPQATVIDGSGEEDEFFMKGLKKRAMLLGKTLIELPDNAEQSMMWMTMLDSASLSAWNHAGIDIIVHAPLTSSGSLIRLLDSLKKADFFSSAPPRLTIELPQVVSGEIMRYLESFRWPPKSDPKSGSLLSLRHRIPQRGLSPEENSIRFLESFWPADSLSSHILVLSPQAELSPLFFHYLKYNILEYKFSANKYEAENLLGISLEVPATLLDDKTAFVPPLDKSAQGVKLPSVSPFLWQAPNSNAALIFGDKWVELHDFVSHSLSSQHLLPTPATLNEKVVSKLHPSWLEHIFKLARTRGYFTLYPNPESRDALATLHNELYQPPEEYAEELRDENSGTELTADPARYKSLGKGEKPLAVKSLLKMLPFKGVLPKMSAMPLLTWDGKVTTFDEMTDFAINYTKIFRREIGGCEESDTERPQVALTAGDLFCLDDR